MYFAQQISRMIPYVSLGQIISCSFDGDKERLNSRSRLVPLFIRSKQVSDTAEHDAALI